MRMKKLLTILILASTIISCSVLGGKSNLTKSEINGIYIPKDLNEAISELNKNFSDSLKTEIKEMPAMVHVQTNSNNKMIWLYDYYLGWKQIDKPQVDLLGEKQENRFELLKKIYRK